MYIYKDIFLHFNKKRWKGKNSRLIKQCVAMYKFSSYFTGLYLVFVDWGLIDVFILCTLSVANNETFQLLS